jgi:hypothetical protein
LLALNAQSRPGQRRQTLRGDRPLTNQALAVVPFGDSFQRFGHLAKEGYLAVKCMHGHALLNLQAETVEDLASSPHRACVILVSGVLDAYLWDEVVRTGGYDVLYKPLREDDVVRSVRLAWSYWNSAIKTAALSGKRLAGET